MWVAIRGVRSLIIDKSPWSAGRPSKRLVISYYLLFICRKSEVGWFRAVLPSSPGLALHVAMGQGLLIRVAGRSLLLVFPLRSSARQWPRGRHRSKAPGEGSRKQTVNSFTYYHLLCGSGGGTASCSANAPSGARAARLVSRLHSFFFTGGILNKKWMQHSLLRGIIYIYDIDITFICNTVHVIYIYIIYIYIYNIH